MSETQCSTWLSVGTPSPSGRTRPTDGGSLQRTQTLGQKIMGNMMDNMFMRSFTSRPKIQTPDASQPSSPSKVGFASLASIFMHLAPYIVIAYYLICK